MGPLFIGWLQLLAQVPALPPPPPPSSPPSTAAPVGQPMGAPPPPAAQQADASYQRPPEPEDDDVVDWFVRLDIGFGPRGLSENSALLSEIGYGGLKLWMTMDGAWMFHEHVGAGLFMGLNRRMAMDQEFTSSEGDLRVVSYFIGVQLPILLAGNRNWAFHVTPRGGYATGVVGLTEGNSGEFQHTGTFGAAVSFQSFLAHIGTSIVFMRTPTGPPGELGRDMDYGGLYFTLGGSIDG